jgi:hypothetical protein
MRYRELTTPELEHRLEKLIADRHYNRLASRRVMDNAVRQGIDWAQSHYIAQLMPGRETRQRKLIQQRRQALAQKKTRAQFQP